MQRSELLREAAKNSFEDKKKIFYLIAELNVDNGLNCFLLQSQLSLIHILNLKLRILMVLILDGNSEIDVHVRTILC